MKKRVLIVNTFFDEYRRTGGSPQRVPRAMGPVFLAGAFEPSSTEVQLYNEQHSGPLRRTSLLGWPDMLVLTGLTASFDRMLHLTAYARTLNPKVVVVAGGPAVRALPIRAAHFFDHVCTGDIEALRDVAREVLGVRHVAEEIFPRFDLADPLRLLAYVESSRYCNFRCGFCSLTGEAGRYRHYDLGYLAHQLKAVGNRQIVFIDNNFYGNDRRFFHDRLALLEDFYKAGRIRGWSALVTGDFFARPENLRRAREAGCFALFSGVESFDAATLKSQNKRHSIAVPQIDMIRSCLEAGILFLYGIMLDPSARPLDELRAEIDFIVGSEAISLPSFFTLAIPLLGTPYFDDCLARGMLLPRTRLRDLDGVTLAMKPLDPIEDAVAFARDLPSLRGHRRGLARHASRFAWRYRARLSALQLFTASMNALLIGSQSLASSPTRLRFGRPRQTYLSTTETLDPLYRPMMRLPERYRAHFCPTMITDDSGALSADIAPDLAARSSKAILPAA